MKSFYAVILVLFLMLWGCAIGKTVVPEENKGFPSPQSALEAIKPRNNTDTLYQATTKVTHTSPQGKMIFRLAVMMQSPDKLRIESIPVFGPPDFFLTTQQGRLRVYLPGTQELITGNAGPSNLSHFLPLAWSAERWIAVLLGNRPKTSSDTESTRGIMEGQLYRVDVLNGQSIEESLWINPENKHLEKLELITLSGGKENVLFSAFREMEGITLPQNIIIDTGEETTIRITYETLEIKKEVNNNLFELSPPPEVVIRDLPD